MARLIADDCRVVVRPIRRLRGPIRYRARCRCGWFGAWYANRDDAQRQGYRHAGA